MNKDVTTIFIDDVGELTDAESLFRLLLSCDYSGMRFRFIVGDYVEQFANEDFLLIETNLRTYNIKEFQICFKKKSYSSDAAKRNGLGWYHDN